MVPPIDRGRLELALAVALENDHQSAHAREFFEAAAHSARLAGDFGLLADVALAAYGPSASGSEYTDTARQLLEEALAGIGRDDAERRVQLLNGIASACYYSDMDREGLAAREAMTVALASRNPLSVALAKLALRRWYTHDPTARVARLALTESALEVVPLDAAGAEVHLNVARALVADQLENADIAGFEAQLAQYERNAAVLGSPRHIHFAMTFRAAEATMHGDLELGEQLARGAALRGRELEQNAAGTQILQNFVIRYQQGRLHEEIATLRAAATANTVFHAGAALGATAYAETGQLHQATEVTRATLGTDGESLPRDAFWLGAVALFAGVSATSGDRELAQTLNTILEPCRGSPRHVRHGSRSSRIRTPLARVARAHAR